MISTLTTSTVSIISGTLSDSLAAMGILLLLGLLFQKELASVAGSRFQRLVKWLNVGIAPLLIAFILIMFSRAIDVIR